MENNKYYTPKIEELYKGFKCELCFYKEFGQKEPVWIEAEIPTQTYANENNYNFDYILEKGNIRVKYLDREDIESLGWEFVGKDEFFDCINYNIGDGYVPRLKTLSHYPSYLSPS